MPFVSKAQRRWMYANEPAMAKEWQEHTPKGTKLPEHVKHVKKAYDQGALSAFMTFVKTSETLGELRLKLNDRSFHGINPVSAKQTARGLPPATLAQQEPLEDSDALSSLLETLPVPKSPKDQVEAKNRLDRDTVWSGPSSMAGGDAANRISDMGQKTDSGKAF